ncbi:hypothetical protein [Lentimicrobium sp. S6]|uniref:hypothetical protein n=1 Tax=Lentimicrobium sp. S6 TaxID=2735872 RepID=UPI0015560DA8|nr:hypothetical protein [Lentimicrobium sp. S6]NPD44962.1 hypothetical protein [Lentimicrobium sp. S6]
MRFVKVLGVIALVAVLVYVFRFRNMGQESAGESIEQVENIDEHDHDHDHDHSHEQVSEEYNHEQVQKEHENKPYYQGEIINLAHGGGYTFLEILESTDLSFWIVVDKVDAKKGDFVMFKEDLVAQNFHSKALDRTFEEIMFATDLQYRVSE